MARKSNALRVVGARAQGDTSSRVCASTGAFASVEGDEIVVHDPHGAIVVRYDSQTGSATILAPSGDLRLAAPKGKVVVEAGTDLELSAQADTCIRSELLHVKATRGKLDLTAVDIVSEAVALTSSKVALGVGQWELSAGRILERAVDVYREVEDLVETRAGRLRALIRGATQVTSGSTSVVSKDDTFVDGRRVLLG